MPKSEPIDKQVLLAIDPLPVYKCFDQQVFLTFRFTTDSDAVLLAYHLEIQAKMPISEPLEVGRHAKTEQRVLERLFRITKQRGSRRSAFSDKIVELSLTGERLIPVLRQIRRCREVEKVAAERII